MIRKTLTTLFADVQGYTTRTGRQTREQHEHFIIEIRSFIEKQAKEKNGNFVKAMGDGFMLTFESPTDAVACGISIQKQMSLRHAIRRREKPVLFRIGISTGEVMVDETGDTYGEAVNIAARIEAFAMPGEVYISEATYLAMNKSEFNAINLGPQKFKNIRQEINVYRVFEGSADVITSLQRPISKKHIQTAFVIIAVVVIGLLYVFFSQEKPLKEAAKPGPEEIYAKFELMLNNKDFRGIIDTADRMLLNDPDNGQLYAFKGEALLALRDFQRAETYLEKAILLDPENPGVYHMLSELFAEKKEFSQAINYLAEYLRREENPEEKDLGIKRMQELEMLKKEYVTAAKPPIDEKEIFGEPPKPKQKVTKSKPDISLQKQASVSGTKENIEGMPAEKPQPQSRLLDRQLRKMSPEESAELRRKLKEYMLDNDYHTARALLIESEAPNADNPAFFIFASKLYLKMDDYVKAENMLMTAIDLDPDDPTPYYGLSVVYEEMGNFEESIRMCEEVMYKDDNEIRRRKMEDRIMVLKDKIQKTQ